MYLVCLSAHSYLVFIITSDAVLCDVCSKIMPVQSICLLNVVVKQEILIKTQKTKQAASCRL